VDVVNGVTSPTASVALTIAEDLSIPPTSPTHSIVVTERSVALAADAALDRDIVIRWAVPRQRPGSSIRTMRPSVGDTAYGLLTIVPPTAHRELFARDLVLLLDVSGSMRGKPLSLLKAVVTSVIASLGDADRIVMIAFSTRPVRFHEEPAPATATERRNAAEWIQSLQAGGGTELIPAIEEALRPLRNGVPRQVIVVTDGLIGFETSAIRTIRDGLPRGSRLHTVGVGSASNRAFLRPAARAGRGVEVMIDLDESPTAGAERVVAATREPVVIDVAIEGSALQASAPRLPDLLSGSPVVAPLRIRSSGGTLVVRGVTPQGPWEQRLEVPSPVPSEGSEAIAALWARETIEELELDLASGGDRKGIDEMITRVGVEHAVLSRLTSWVAISEQPSVDPRDPVRVERIPQALPYGMDVDGLGFVGAMGFPLPAVRATSSAVSLANVMLSPPPAGSPPPRLGRALWRNLLTRQKARFNPLGQLQAALNAGLVNFTDRRDRMNRLFESQMAEAVSLRDEIRAALATLKAERSSFDPQWKRQAEGLERLLADVDASLETLETESQHLRRAWASQFEAVDRLRDRIEVAVARLEAPVEHNQPAEDRRVFLRGRLLPTPGRSTVTVEIYATTGFHWRPAGKVTIGGQEVTVIEQGTTRPGPVAIGSLVRLEISGPSTKTGRPNNLEIPSDDAILVVALDVAD
jgi:hypothetical protein